MILRCDIIGRPRTGETAMLPAPGFHHLHLNSVDPDAAIDFYVRQFPTSAKASWGGLPGLAAPNNVLILFTRVAAAPATAPQTAIWHFGWHGTDTRQRLESYKGRPDVNLRVFAGRTSRTPVTEATCTVARGSESPFPALEPDGMFRTPSAAVVFGDVAFLWYMRQGDRHLVSPRGHVYDHIALSVPSLDAWVAKLRRESVRFLEEPYKLGGTRAVMIEGPSREALELVEIK